MQTREILRIKGNALYTVPPGETLAAALGALVENDIGSLVVMDHGRLIGMLSFREVLRAMHEHGREAVAGTLRVADVMVREPPQVGPDMEVEPLREFMLAKRCRYVPVMDAATLLGVISFHDVAKAVVEEQAFENRMLKGYIKNWPDE